MRNQNSEKKFKLTYSQLVRMTKRWSICAIF